MFVIVENETGKVLSVNVDEKLFPNSIEAPNDIIYGDLYIDGEFQRIAPRPDPIEPTPQLPTTEERLTAIEDALLMIL